MQHDLGQIAVTAVVKKTLSWKIGVAAGVIFLASLIVMGALVPTPSASASSCEDTGVGTGAAAPVSGNSSTTSSRSATGGVHDQQLRNARTIDKVATRLHLPGKATLIALMAAMQESSLQNLDHGLDDSIGLFQQRPSQNWGTKQQIMDPEFATESFLNGRGSNKGLVDITNWTTRPPGDVAQAIQGSAYPDLYAGHESEVRALAQEAGIDLARKGTATSGTSTSTAGSTTPSGDTPSQCPATDTATGTGASSGTFTDGTSTVTLHNPRTVTEAIAWARSHSGTMSTALWYRRCLAFVANVYGWSYSGVDYAIDHYKVVPASMRHPGDRHPPPGALLYWDTGHRAGHIAVYLGNGEIASNDILRPGYIDIVKADQIEARWGATYVGWTPPVFPRAG